MTLRLTTGDTAPVLTGNVNANITGATLEVHVVRPDATIINRAGTITDPTNGGWSLPIIAGDLTVRGTYKVEVQVTFSGGAIETFAYSSGSTPTTFEVRDQYA